MTYIAGVVTPIPLEARTRYAEFAHETSGLFKDFGATRVVDSVGDDIPFGKINDFKTAVQATKEEAVGFGWMEYADKAAYLAAGEKMRTDPRMQAVGAMPFDGKRMIFGGFEMIVDEGAAGATGYIDGFLLAVPTANKEAYRQMALQVAPHFIEQGVRRYAEAWGDHLPRGEVTDFFRATHAENGENVVFAWVEWPDKATRDAGMKAIAAMEPPTDIPFDGKRMMFGGFKVVSEA